jgi:GNAT superfamily N-acetyltransferase
MIVQESQPRLQIAPREYRKQDFVMSTDPSRLDLDTIHGYLTRSWWTPGISKETVERSLHASLCFGVYHGDRQIGFARVISDFATYAYICDDFILEDYQGRGLGRWLMESILAHPDLQGLRRWTLIAEDPRIYSKFGFKPLEDAGINMEIVAPAKR